MKIVLTTNSTNLGKKGDHVEVGISLASGLVRKGHAEIVEKEYKTAKVHTKELKVKTTTKVKK